MNCAKCVSVEVCFMQKQIENLADRATQGPFLGRPYKQDSPFHESVMVTKGKISHKIREAIASDCPLFR